MFLLEEILASVVIFVFVYCFRRYIRYRRDRGLPTHTELLVLEAGSNSPSPMPNSCVPKQWPGHEVPLPILNPIGRDREIEQVFNALRLRTSVAVTGIAGIGKTTILAHAIRKLGTIENNPYTDLCFHRIAERDSREERLNRLLLSLITSINPHTRVESSELSVLFAQARRLMAERNLLLAVDNADDAESHYIVQDVLRNLPQLTLGVTSRQLVWQNILVVRLQGLSEPAAVELFELTYKNVLNEDDKKMAGLLCKHVLGHPMMINHLALEAQESHCSLQELNANLPILDIDRDLGQRFDSIRNRLTESCHRVLDAISVLDTATLRVDLVKQVTQASKNDLELMESQYLIHFHPDRRRFDVHELMRSWCQQKLVHASEDIQKENELERLRIRIAEFYQSLLKKNRLGNPEDLAEIDPEWPNILGLIDGLANPHVALVLLDEAIGDHFDDPNGYVPRRGQMMAISTRSERLLRLANEAGGLLAARLEKNLGHFFYWQGDYKKAQDLFLRSRDRYVAEGNTAGEAVTTWLLGYLADDENRYRDAQTLYERGTELAWQVKPFRPELVAVGHHLIGCTLYHQGQFEEAEIECRRARGLIKDTAPHLLVRIDHRLGSVALELGRVDEAEMILSRTAELVKHIERPRDAARISRHLGVLHLRRGDLQQAEKFLEQALKGFTELQALRGIGYTYHGLAMLRRKQGNLKEATEFCEKSLQIAKQTESLYGEAAVYEELANIQEADAAPVREIERQRQHACNIFTVIGHERAKKLVDHLREMNTMTPNLPSDIKGVLFDLMDTLAFLKPEIYEEVKQRFSSCLNVSLERFKWAWTSSREKASTGIFKTTEARIRWVAEALDIAIADEKCLQMASEEEGMWRDNVQFYDEAITLLERLRQLGIRLAIVSNGPVAMECLNHALGLSSLIDDFILSSKVGVTKPEPSIYAKAIESLGLLPSQCIFVGDGNDHELDGAQKVGLYTVKIKRPRPPYADVKNESLDWNKEVNNLGELQSLFQALTHNADHTV